MTDNPQLSRGSRGEWVTYLQQVLEFAGHSPGAADGVFGGQTEAAVRSFQEARGLSADGIVGDATWGALATSTEPTQAAAEDGTQATESQDGQAAESIIDWGPDPTQWTEDQQAQFFSYNDVLDDAESLSAEVDVPEIQEA